ncbi:MAG: hypothetical protein AAB676_02605 [Verrucomicrobiota bacterium]
MNLSQPLLFRISMGIIRNLKFRFWPPQLIDPEFGFLSFKHLPKNPAAAYWKGEWKFPITQFNIAIRLPGDEKGPFPQSRQFLLELPQRFENILALARPRLAEVFKEWLEQELPKDVFRVVDMA